jgi:maltooligosyltrehalose trehalohydrolase
MMAGHKQGRAPGAAAKIVPRTNCFGPILCDGGVMFRIWAPDAGHIDLRVNGAAPQEMRRQADGHWQLWLPVGPGSEYRFDVDGVDVPDPASRFQPHDVDGPSQIIDAERYRWNNQEWRGRPWEETVLYELHVGLLGGFAGVTARLASLAALGITAIELMPIADFPGARNWGYDGVLPFAPDSAYGHPDDLRALIDAAHGHRISVFLDVVYNHFGPHGNYLGQYAPAFFDPATHTPWGAAIDFANSAVQTFFVENALYWLEEFKFDGLRLDAVHAIKERSWLVRLAAEIRTRITTRQVHLVLENENNDARLLREGFDAQWNDDFHNVVHVLLTGETRGYYWDFADRPAERLARCLAEGFVYQGESAPSHQNRRRGEPSAALPPSAFVNFLQNHDQTGNRAFGDRLTTIAPAPAVRAAMALLLLCPQIPMLFMGEEAGASEPFLFFTDFHGDLGALVRDGRRQELARLGYVDEKAKGAVPDPNASATYTASQWTTEGPDATAWHDLVGSLLSLRSARIAPVLKGTTSLGAEARANACVIARWRLGDGTTLTIVVNFGIDPVPTSLPIVPPIFGTLPEPGTVGGYTTLAWISA